jgi:N-acetylneuraminic acid mutarotase
MSFLSSWRNLFRASHKRRRWGRPARAGRGYRPTVETFEDRLCPSGSWTTESPMLLARASSASAVINGELYVAGGSDGHHQTTTLQSYSTSTNTWTQLADMPSYGRYGDVGGTINGKLYVVGGWDNQYTFLPHNDLFIYDPASNTWTSGASMPHLSANGAAGVINGKLYVTTPDDGFNGYRTFLDVYDPAGNSWTGLAPSPHVHEAPAFGVINGKFYVAGGGNGSGATDVLDVYDPTTNTWTTSASMPSAVAQPAGAVLNDKLYVVGGADAAGNNLSIVQVYDPATDTWTTDTPMPTARNALTSGVVNGVLYAVGGANASGVSATNEAFTPGTNQPRVTLFSADPQFAGLADLTTDGSTGFYLSGSNGAGGGFDSQQIFHLGMSGGAATVFSAANNALGITNDGAYVYWIDPNGDPDATAVFRVPIAGGPRDKIYSGFATGQPVVDGSGIAFVPGSGSPGTLVTADEVQGRVHSMTAGNPVSGITQLGPNRYGGFFNEEHFNSVAVDNGIVYIADSGNPNFSDTPRVQSIPLGSGSFTDLFVGSLPGFSPRGIAVHGNTIYLTSGTQVLQMPTTGGTPTLLASDPRFANLGGITFFNNALYVIDQHPTFAEVWEVDLSAATTAPFAGSYTGTYRGTATVAGHNRAVRGGLHFTIDSAGDVRVTNPGTGQGAVTPSGHVTISGIGTIGGIPNVSYPCTGTVVIPPVGRLLAEGTWTATFSGGSASGIWGAAAPVTPSVTVSDAGGTYNGHPFPASATARGANGAAVKGSFTFTYDAGGSVSGAGSARAPVNAGTYSVVASFHSGDPNYANARGGPVTFTIAPAAPKVTLTDAGGVYNGRPFPASVRATGVGGAAVGGRFTFTYYPGGSPSGAGSATPPVNAGTYTVVASFASGNRNYAGAQGGPVTFTIVGARPRVTVSAVGGTYNGQLFPAGAAATGLGGAAVTGSFGFTYYTGRSAGGAGTSTAPTDAGTYTVVASFTSGDPNYGDGQSGPVTFVIARAMPAVTVTDAGGGYNGQPFPASATATGVGGAAVSGSFGYTYFAGSSPGGAGSATPPTAAGTYTVVASFLSSDPNYGNARSGPVTFTIAPPGTLLVTTASDLPGHSGTSLRDAIATADTDVAAGRSDQITFAAGLAGATITLSQGPLELTAGTGIILIDGGGRITVSGNQASRVFQVDSGANALLGRLTIENGSTGEASGGAGILNSGTLAVIGSTLSGNTTPTFGGGIANYGKLLVSNSTFSRDSAGSPIEQNGGGGIYDAGSLTVTNSTFSSNYGWYGGGIYVPAAGPNPNSALVSNCTFSGNFGFYGCGIDNEGQTVTLMNCTFNGNGNYGSGGTSFDGAVENGGIMNVFNCTIYGNGGSNNGGIDNLAALGRLTLVNTIVAGNTCAFGYPPDLTGLQSGATATGNNNIIGDKFGYDTGFVNGVNGNQVGTHAHPINPLLGPLRNNGGPTQTMALLRGSPALAAGGSIAHLTTGLSVSATTLTFSANGTSQPYPADVVLRIDGEEMLVTISGHLVRGYNGTRAAAHKAGALIYLASDQRGVLHGNPTDIGAFQ